MATRVERGEVEGCDEELEEEEAVPLTGDTAVAERVESL